MKKSLMKVACSLFAAFAMIFYIVFISYNGECGRDK